LCGVHLVRELTAAEARNLLERLRDQAHSILHFADDP
jgi:hypothetical protein